MHPLDRTAATVLAAYPRALRLGPPVPLGNSGGFSGARLWRVASAAGPLCLRAWPPRETCARVEARHRLMARARAAGLDFVPALVARADARTVAAEGGRLWELTAWLPGHADFHARPSPARLREACRALARLHTAWEPAGADPGPCPALGRRVSAAAEWQELVRSGWAPPAGGADPLRPLVERAWRALARHVRHVPEILQPWREAPLRLQPCLCDVWHDHLLFEGERLTGLVDYGAVKVDAVAADLARLLGSLVGGDDAGWRAGLGAYREVRPFPGDEEALARALDRTGVVLGLASWLRWLYEEGRAFDDRAAVARRIEGLVARVESLGESEAPPES